jgi:hypothetical protein
MKLYGMQTAFTASLNSKLHGHLMADELLAHLVESEWLDREMRKRNAISARLIFVIRPP